jgi:phosphoglycolate phosphatase-like HAD superfamily hydrolase
MPVTKPERRPLYLWDYDGIWVKARTDSYSIMRHAIDDTLKRHGIPVQSPMEELDWKKIFADTAGGTEHRFVSTVFTALGVKPKLHDRLFPIFIQTRAELIREFNFKNGLRKFDDEMVYRDTKILQARLSEKYPRAIFGLVTGNPLWVMEQRLPAELENVFDLRIGGEYGYDRSDMIRTALTHARELGWEGYRDELGMYVNAFYFDDSEHGAVGGLRAGCKTVYVDRPKGTPDHEMVYNGLIAPRLLKEFGPAKAETLLVGQIQGETIRGTQSIFTSTTLDHLWLLTPDSFTGVYDGWLDTRAHDQGRSFPDVIDHVRQGKEGI